MLTVDSVLAADGWSRHARDWPALADRCAGAAVQAIGKGDWLTDPPEREIALLLADDAELRRLNAAWRGIDAPTNVLSFPALDDPGAPADGAPVLLGDIAIGLETVTREAAEQGKTLEAHVAHMIVHGVLHLMGLDHEAEDEAEHMEAAERRALAGLGIADPYAAGPIGHEA